MNRIQWAAATALSLPMLAYGSSHREAPAIARSPALDGTDLYLFNSYEANHTGYVTILANYNPLQDPFGGPNYFAMDPNGLYEIMIDNDGDAKENLTFQFRFTNTLANGNKGIQLPVGPAGTTIPTAIPLKNAGPVAAGNNANLNFIENYSLTMVTGDRRTGASVALSNSTGTTFTKPMDYIGQKSFGTPDAYAAYAGQYVYNITLPIPNCTLPGRVFVGQRKEGFAVNLGETFDLVNNVPIEGDSAPGAGDGAGFPGGITSSPLKNVLRMKNITTLALELPIACVTGAGNGVIGAWSTASVRQVRVTNPNATFAKTEVNGGAYTQVSRTSAPLVNELVIGLPDKDHFNSSAPSGDAQFLNYVTNPSLPELLNVLFLAPVNATLGTTLPTLAPTNFPRNDLVATFLTGFKGVNQMATVTPSEMMRLNTGIPAVPAAAQSPYGVVGNDLAGFPNGRRPGDSVVDLSLRVVMGALCYPIPLAGVPTNLGICAPTDAAVGNVAFTDGAPISSADFDVAFPYLKTPLPGSPIGAQGI